MEESSTRSRTTLSRLNLAVLVYADIFYIENLFAKFLD